MKRADEEVGKVGDLPRDVILPQGEVHIQKPVHVTIDPLNNVATRIKEKLENGKE